MLPRLAIVVLAFAAAPPPPCRPEELRALLGLMPRGLRGLTYHPARTGRSTVGVQAVDLLNHSTRGQRPLVVRPCRRA